MGIHFLLLFLLCGFSIELRCQAHLPTKTSCWLPDNLFLFTYFMGMNVFTSVCVCVPYVSLVPEEVRSGHWVPWD